MLTGPDPQLMPEAIKQTIGAPGDLKLAPFNPPIRLRDTLDGCIEHASPS